MAERKGKKVQTTIYKTLHKKTKNRATRTLTQLKMRVKSGASEG